MLKKAHISNIKPPGEAWQRARLAKFTSSEIHYLTYPTGFTEGSINYIRRKVGEELTGKSSKDEIVTDATIHGLKHEAAAVHKFGLSMGLDFIIVQQLITAPGSRRGGTPDGLIVLRESPDLLEYEVETIEVKCPPTYDAYIGLFKCQTPLDLKREKREYYWQVLDQMELCGAKRGHFVIYHPDFKAGNHKSMTFETGWSTVDEKGKKCFPIYADLKLLRERKDMADARFEEIRDKLMGVAAL